MASSTVHRDLSPAEQHASLTNAGATIEQLIKRDSQYPDLADLLRGPTSENYVKRVSPIEQDFIKSHSIQIPDNLAEQIDQLECRCFMGVLPEIKRAWITVDHRLFLWNYVDGSDFYTYEDQDQIICGVGLVKPKPDSFGENINYVLVLATPVSISILAVSIDDHGVAGDRISLFFTDLSIPSDGVQMSQITGTDDGRIFMVGDDGRVYELEYHQKRGWFQRQGCSLITRTQTPFNSYLPTFLRKQAQVQVVRIAVDSERKVLYMLSNMSTIDVVYLGNPTNPFQIVASNNDICNQARLACRQSTVIFDPSEFQIRNIHVISKAESKKVHLLAVSTSGFCMYFTHHRDALRYMTNNQDDQPPNALELIHIRLPPPVEISGATPMMQGQENPNGIVHESYYDCGTMITAKIMNEDKDKIIMTAADMRSFASQLDANNNTTTTTTNPTTTTTFPTSTPAPSVYSSPAQRMTLVETSTSIECDGRVYAIAEANVHPKGKQCINEISKRLTEPPRQFLVLSGKGLTFFVKQRPVDILQQLLLNARDDIEGHAREFLDFFAGYGRVQSCAMCLAIVCANFGATTHEQVSVIRGATQLFFECGGSPAAAPSITTGSNFLGKATGPANTIYSGKHDGFALYFARLVAPVWSLKVFEIASQPKATQNTSKLQAKLLESQRDLVRLKSFMDANQEFHASANITDSRFQSADQGMLQVLVNEQQSLHSLYILLTQCIEAISFLDFLIDAGIQEIFQGIPESARSEIHNLSLDTMLKDPRGRVMTRELVIAAINKYGASHTHVGFDIVSDLLRRKCSSFFGPSDVAFYKGVENLRRAQRADVEQERYHALTESLDLFKQGADYLTDEKLSEICAAYDRQHYYLGSVELPLERAQKLDPQQQALAYTEGRAPFGDAAGQQFHQERKRCYEHVFRALQSVRASCNTPDANRHAEAVHYANRVLQAALSYQDKHFHYELYEWFLQEGHKRDLLVVDSKFLIPFFKERVSEVEGMDFLWQYYRRKEQYYEAALYLDALASRPNGLPLLKRVEYLALAMVNARCRDPKQQKAQESTQLLQQLERSIGYARIQMRLQHALNAMATPESQQAARELDNELLDLSDLYNKYAQPFGIIDEERAILQLADYNESDVSSSYVTPEIFK